MKQTLAKSLQTKIKKKTAKIGIIGLGYVGLPLAHGFASKGFKVVGIDAVKERVGDINQSKCYIQDISATSFKKVIKSGKLKATQDYKVLSDVDVIIVCVPTPLNRFKDPDISHIVTVTKGITQRLTRGQLIILESTTYPGTTEEVILPALQKSKLKVGKDFFLCFSPERIDPGNPDFNTQNIPKVVGGVTSECGDLGVALYESVTSEAVKVSSPRTAEMAKLLENTFRIVNIGLVNELAQAAENLKVNIWEAIDAAKTKPFGYMAFYPGPGIGGHCIGVDPVYLSWKARLHGSDLHFIELARRINAEMPMHVVSQSVYALNRHLGKAISRSRVMVLGVSYKKDVADTRESPALDLLVHLKKLGAKISYHDPFVPELEHKKIKLKSTSISEANLKKQDLVILATNHTKFPYGKIVKCSKLIYDTRNELKKYTSKNIVRL